MGHQEMRHYPKLGSLTSPKVWTISSGVNQPDCTSCSFEFLRSNVLVTVLMNNSCRQHGPLGYCMYGCWNLNINIGLDGLVMLFRASLFSPTSVNMACSSSLLVPPWTQSSWICWGTWQRPDGFFSQSRLSRAACASLEAHGCTSKEQITWVSGYTQE